MINPEGGFCSECGDHFEHESDGDDTAIYQRISGLEASLKRIESALAVLAADALTDVPLPSSSDEE